MHLRRFFLASGVALTASACASSTARPSFEDEPEPTPETDTSSTTPPPAMTGEFGEQAPPPEPEDLEINEVYGHSATTLYKLEPKTKAVTVVGNFNHCGSVNDIALDEDSTMYGVTSTALYVIDKSTANCTLVNGGTGFPNSLSFVPKGTLDPNVEALVGYNGGDYVRIDVKTGTKTIVGKLGGKLVSSGDIVSVKGGKTYLTVKGGSCNTNDCLVEVDPATGEMLKNWGSIEHRDVFGLAFWGGMVYGFDKTGSLFEVTFGADQLATQAIAIPSKPSNFSFWGAGSSTSVPLVTGPQ